MISLDDAKRHLNLTTTDDDALVQDKIDAATGWIALFVSGPTDDTAPAPLKEACRQLVAHFYANREATLTGATAQSIPFGVSDLLAPYRVY